MKRIATLSVLALLAACATPQEAARDGNAMHATALETQPDGAVCRVGADGGPVAPPGLASAAIPPTSPRVPPLSVRPVPVSPVAVPPLVVSPRVVPALAVPPLAVPPMAVLPVADHRQADRGIGGTGAPSANSQLADRGIGGTGIVGVITGFASVCVDGLEVAYDSSAAVDIDGTAGTPSALRAGQLVVIQAKGSTAAPVAQTISVRRQVTGRIESIELGTGTLTIAGQAVSVPAGTWGADTVRLGDWVAVSGLHRTDGLLIASRLDLAPAGAMTVRGQVMREGDTARIGDLVLNGAAAADLKAGQYVMVSGQYVGGRAQVHAVTQDPVFGNPTSYFGTSVNHLVLQAFVRVANGAVYLNGLKVTAGPGVSGKPGADGVAVVSLERKPDGSFTAVGLRYTDRGGSIPGAIRMPAGTSRGSTMTPLQTRRPAAQMMALTGNGSSSGAGPTVATTATMSGPVGTSPTGTTSTGTSQAVTTNSTGVVTTGPATALTPPTAVVNVPPPVIVPPPTVIIPPPSVNIPPSITVIMPPVGSGAKIESVTPITSQLMSSLPGANGAIRPVSVARSVAALRPAIVAASATSATVSLATEAVVAPPPQIGAGSVKTPAVLAPPSSRSGGIKPISGGLRNGAIGGAH